MFRTEGIDLQFNRHKAGQGAVVEQQVDEEIRVTDLNTIFFTDESKVMSKFQNKIFEMRNNLPPQIFFLVRLFKIKKFKHIRVAQSRKSAISGKQILVFLVRNHCPLIQHTANLTIQLAFCVAICYAQAEIEFACFIGLTSGHNQQIARPRNFSHQW